MFVTVKFAGPLRDAAGTSQTRVELDRDADTGALVERLARAFPGLRRAICGADAKGYWSLFVNDALVPEAEKMRSALQDGDEVLFLLPIAGGLSVDTSVLANNPPTEYNRD
jgi:molybdopterin converting factor small subunit